MQAVQDPVYSQVGGLYKMGDESATLTNLFRKIITSAALTAARTLTLPSALLMGFGTTIEVNDVFGAINGANTLSIAPNGTDTINGANSTLVMAAASNRITLTSDGVSKWTGAVGGGASSGSGLASKYTKNTAAGATTAAAGDMTGGNLTVAEYSAVGAANLTTRTALQLIADGGLQVGQTYTLRVLNSSGGTTTLVAGSNVTITGTATMATQTWREFQVKVTGVNTVTLTNLGTGANS